MKLNLPQEFTNPFLWIVIVCVGILLWLYVNQSKLREWTQYYNKQMNTEFEGFQTTYTFFPNKSMQNINFNVSPQQLKLESIELLRFFKKRKGLIQPSSATKNNLLNNIPKISPAAARPQVPQIDFDALKSSIKIDDSFTTMHGGDEPFTPGELQESFSTGTIQEPLTSSDDYGDVDINTIELYQYYTILKQKEDDTIDKTFSRLFDIGVWREYADKPESLYSEFVTAIGPYNYAYSLVKYMFIQKRTDKSFSKNQLAKYVFDLTKKYSYSSAKLAEIKDMFIKIIKPTFTFSQLFAEFKNNNDTYLTKPDALFFINTAIDTIKADSIEDLNRSPTQSVYVFKDDTDDYNNKILNYDCLRFANTLFVIGTIYKLASEQFTNFAMTKDTFFNNYSIFLTKNTNKKLVGFYKFVSDPKTPHIIIPTEK